MIPNHFVQELLNRVDIVDVVDTAVPLKKAGANYVACCPFHGEKTPSFTVSPTKQFYHCFGCGAHGTAIGFVMEYHGLGFVEAVEDLAKRAGVAVPREAATTARAPRVAPDLYEVMKQASQYYRGELKKSPRAIEYLKGRGLSGEIAAKFQIGYAPPGWQPLRDVFPEYESEALSTVGLTIRNDEGRVYDRFRDRVMFPIHDQRGQIIGFGGRVLGGDGDGPKYLNSPETPLFQKGQELYGLFLARPAIRASGKVVVVEGYMDVVALSQHGVEYAVATLGTATTPLHIAKLTRQTEDIVFCFDGDAAGRKAAWRAAMNALPAVTDGLKLSFLFLPPEHDPDSYVREFGREGFESALSEALPLSTYVVEELSGRHELGTPEGRVRFLEDAKPILQQLQAPKFGLMLRKRVAELAGVSQSEVEQLLKLEAPKPIGKVLARAPRKAPTLTRKLLQLLMLKPQLARSLESEWVPSTAVERDALVHVIESVQADPMLNSAALLQGLQGIASQQLLGELAGELLAWDEEETFDLENEFDGAVRQLRGATEQREFLAIVQLAQERGLQALSPEQREILQQFRRPATQKE
ncbi:DNA primase [Novimethylophilus kurashikiensis]|uniref:DNA primase n=1 Tax=Novimethylophilus kurashikiensis TaxID=1825523 RepID=A0A2R5F4P4_9PROT|nr:DNA primase [Novimethylophilus kurashikiensis]GBG13380.1 DNA primase [Novimethylophilus kurashikiensis]